MLKGTGHASDLGGLGAGLLRGLPPSRRHPRDVLDDAARRRETETEIFRGGLEKIDRAGAFVRDRCSWSARAP